MMKAVSSPVVTSGAVLEFKLNLNKFIMSNRVSGHAGIQSNEKADELAKLGAEDSFIGPEDRFGVSKVTRIVLSKVCQIHYSVKSRLRATTWDYSNGLNYAFQ